MASENSPTGSLRPQELEAVYAISQAVAKAVDTETALDEIIRLVRPVFIFDNIVLFEIKNNQTLEMSYARAIGRGRSKEADLVWGEKTAHQVFQAQDTILNFEEVEGDREDRTNIRHSLGIPLRVGDQVKGVLVFLRFGGPSYQPDQIHLAEFISTHIAQLLERHQLIERIASLEARRQLEGLQADFIALISHELLTPLGFIKGYATTLLREDTSWDDSTRHEFLSIIAEESDNLHELIENLMDSSRLQAGTLKMTFQPVRLDTLIKEVCSKAKSVNEKLAISINNRSPGLQLQADPTRLAQVFMNILTNAAKYAPGSPINITIKLEKHGVCINIQDQGPGIQPENMKYLFQRFYRAPEHRYSSHGTGLGLYICRQIVQAHSGEIEAKSVVGKGTTFIIHLPIEQKELYKPNYGGEDGYQNLSSR